MTGSHGCQPTRVWTGSSRADEPHDRVVGERPEASWQVRLLAAGASLRAAWRHHAVEGGGVEADPLDAVVAEQALDACFEVGIVVEGVVAQFDRVTMRDRQCVDERAEGVDVGWPERRRQLDRDLLGAGAERGDAFQKRTVFVGDVTQVMFMGDRPGQLEDEPEPLRCLTSPRRHAPRSGQPVEGGVSLGGIAPTGVHRQLITTR